jgi:hypothetical protein
MVQHTALEDAFAAEVLAEVARQGRTHKEVQATSGIRPRTWSGYFVQRDVTIPFPAMEKVSDALGVDLEVLLRRAREQLADDASHAARARAALDRATPAAQRRARNLARELREDPEEPASAARKGDPRISRSVSTG